MMITLLPHPGYSKSIGCQRTPLVGLLGRARLARAADRVDVSVGSLVSATSRYIHVGELCGRSPVTSHRSSSGTEKEVRLSTVLSQKYAPAAASTVIRPALLMAISVEAAVVSM